MFFKLPRDPAARVRSSKQVHPQHNLYIWLAYICPLQILAFSRKTRTLHLIIPVWMINEDLQEVFGRKSQLLEGDVSGRAV